MKKGRDREEGSQGRRETSRDRGRSKVRWKEVRYPVEPGNCIGMSWSAESLRATVTVRKCQLWNCDVLRWQQWRAELGRFTSDAVFLNLSVLALNLQSIVPWSVNGRTEALSVLMITLFIGCSSHTISEVTKYTEWLILAKYFLFCECRN